MIDILMATYNGEKYINEQLESIFSQSYQDFKLIIQDDCSTDKTIEIINHYIDTYPKKILLYSRNTPSGSSVANFMDLLQFSTSDYIMFADQDDIWKKDKIQLSYQAMLQQERIYGQNTPILIHTDLTIVDEYKTTLSDSFFSHEHLTPNEDFKKLLIGNYVTGCTMFINRSLLEIAKNTNSNDIYMHDWWFALIAAMYGKLHTLSTATTLYRQHSSNQIGASKKHTLKSVFNRIFNPLKRTEFIVLYRKAYSQAQLLNQLHVEGHSTQTQELQIFLDIMNHNKISKVFLLFKHKYLAHHWIKRIEQILFI